MRVINTGAEEYADIVTHNDFYIDKTMLIKEWCEIRDHVTLIMRPHGFGKTLNLDMLKCFFSNRYAGRSDLFEKMNIWNYEEYRELQGTYPVIFLSFAGIRRPNAKVAIQAICDLLAQTYEEYSFLLNSPKLQDSEKMRYQKFCEDMNPDTAPML